MQKILLEQYCQAHSITEYEFYCDDGYSGTNFNRPAFQQMLNDIHAGNIDLVVVKDLSRFGRNYVEVGLQIEHFKEQNVRFIAADDHYDSTVNEDDLMFPILNELIDKIVVHHKEIAENGRVFQQVEIYYRFIEKLERAAESKKAA